MIDFDAVMRALLVITVGLILLDFVPLQEGMRCTNDYKNASTCPEVFFAQSYHAARGKFIEAAKKAKAQLERHVVLHEDGFEYTVDTAFLRGKNSGRLLVHMSGTDGVEGYIGSAIQVKLLEEWNNSRPEGSSVLFVHAVNPYGMAHFRTTNENNVNLNRNYRSAEDWKSVLARDPNIAKYDDIVAPLMLSRAPRIADRFVFLYHIIKAFVTKGFYAFKTAIISGQYHHPEGMSFGGREEQRSIAVLRSILTKYAAEASEKSIVVDVHTGHGTWGDDVIVASTNEDESLAKSIFTAGVIKGGPSAGYEHSNGFIIPTDILGKNTLVVEQEFGTVNYIFMIRAIFLENAAYRYANGSYVHEVMREWMRDAFYPQSIKYKMNVLKKGVDRFDSAWRYLSGK
ncbi:uncharacterized protein TM35_000071880 [Trypanosoma theileri]|uniref:DUF2817 domain-containing protein n=1 Tax=Trypanosoma theileri TaxID=67003 RepID=A0A1X0P1D9_9TRYP|nr:uncharacterized protein TM35_000071880 [Trypanosoma theileri]ORC90764.1 hypothetical protein TM35_000071880 [Trypanosoma theileri]